MRVDHYNVLEVIPRASREVIHAAYRALCLRDGDDEARLRQYNAAKETLLNDTRRRKYDEDGEQKPKQIGQYKVVSLIAEGGFGKTYKGEHVTLGTPVCIKHASKVTPQDEQIMMEEATSIWDLRHWGIPAIRDIHKLPDGSIALIMSYVPGPTIEQIIKKHEKLDPEHVAWITERLLNILNYLHMHGVVHGDVKPQNVIIQPESHTVTLVDYGLSAIRPKPDDENKGHTPVFSSPEQIANRPLLPESDLYSLGMTMIYMLGGDPQKVHVPATTPNALCQFMKRLIKHDVLARPNWKENLIDTFRDVRMTAFKRTSSGMKPLPV
jgi:serine/threonine protein kinase